jgi:hypothetical protein
MALIKKTLFPENLDKYTTFINDTDINSKYFKITELPDTFTGGKNAFLIAGSSELVADTVVKVEIKDAAGNIIYYEPGEGRMYSEINGEQFISEYYEGVSKVVAVYIYPDTTAYGPCTITILGELSSYYDSDGLLSTIPLDWQGTYNVKWQKTVNVNPTLPNTTKIRFYKRPTVTINEILSPIYQIDSEAGLKINTGINQSFADIRISNLETFAGDVKRVKVFRTSTGDISDYDMIQDILVESKELLITYDLSSSVIGNTGTFTSETLKQYWNTGSLQATLTTDKVESGLKLNGSGNLRYSSSLQLKSTNTYEINLDAFYSSSTDSNIGIYLSGSDGGDVLVGSLNGISPTKNLLDTTIPFKLDSDFASASLYFSQSNGEWHLGNISLKLSEDTAFSPDAISFITSMPSVVNNQDFNFKFEFYDVNSNYVPVLVTGSANFVGGSAAITKLLTFESDRTAFRFSTGSYANPPSQFVKFKTTRTNFTGSVIYSSASFDTNGNYIEPSSYAGAYPGAFQIQNDNEALLSVANFTGSINTVLVGTITFTASCEGFEEYETIYRFEDGDNAPGIFVTSNTNQFIYKATDLSLNPAGQIITIEAKRKNLASATTPLTVNSGSGKPPLTFVSTNATNGVDTYTLAGTTYPYGTGETRYFISGSDQFGNEFSDAIKITPVKILDGLSATLTNDNVSLPALSTGVVVSDSFLFTSGSVNVKVGNETIAFDDDNDGNRANNTFAITNITGLGCTPNSSNPSDNSYSITALSSDSGSLDITIDYKDGTGDSTSLIKTATYTKNKKASPVLEFVIGNNNQTVTAKSTGEQIDSFVNATFAVNETYNGATTQKTFTPTSITATNSYSVGNANATSLILPSMANGTDSVDISVTGSVVDSENTTRLVYGSISLAKVKKASPVLEFVIGNNNQTVTATPIGSQINSFVNATFAVNETYNGVTTPKTFTPTSITATNSYIVGNATATSLILPNIADATDSVDISVTGSVVDSENTTRNVYGSISLVKVRGIATASVYFASPETQTVLGEYDPEYTDIYQLQTATLQDVIVNSLDGDNSNFIELEVTSQKGLTDEPDIVGNTVVMSGTRILASAAAVRVTVRYYDTDGTTIRTQLIIIKASTTLSTDLQDIGGFTAYDAALSSATASFSSSIVSLNSKSGSYATTGSNTFIGNQIVTGTGRFTQEVTFDTVPISLQDATTANQLLRYSQFIAATSVKYLPTSVDTISLSNITLSGTQTIEGEVLGVGKRVLVAGQSTAANNGVYVVAAEGWTRATDSDSDVELRGFIVNIAGTGNYAGYKYINTNTATISIGSTAITYAEFSNLSEIDPVFIDWRDYPTRDANTFWAAPNGSNGIATWRAIVASDINIPNLVSGSSQIVGILSSLNQYTQSQDTKNATLSTVTSSLHSATASLSSSIGGIFAFTQSQNAKNETLSLVTGSLDTKNLALATITGSLILSASATYVFTQSQNTKNETLATFTGSLATKNLALATITGSLISSASATYAFTQSQNTKNLALATFTGSLDTKNLALATITGSLILSASATYVFTQSQNTKNETLASVTSSLSQYNQSQDTKNSSLATITGSLISSASATYAFTASQNTKNETLATFTGSLATKNLALATITGSLISSASATYAFTASQNTKNLALATFTGSIDTKNLALATITGSLILSASATYVFTASQNTKNETLSLVTGSLATKNLALATITGSLISSASATYAFTASQNTKNETLASVTASLIQYPQSQDTKNSALATITGSLILSASATYAFTASQNTKNATLATVTSSLDTKNLALATITGSLISSASATYAFTASQNTKNLALATFTGSLDTKNLALATITGSLILSASATYAFTASQNTKNLALATFTGSIDTTIKTKLNADKVISGSVVHNDTSGYVADEHINHSSVYIVAGAGLDGGGNIMQTRTFDVIAGSHITVNSNDVAVNTTTLIPAISGTILSSIRGDVTITAGGVATIGANSVALGTDTTGNYVASLAAGTNITIVAASGEGVTPTIGLTNNAITIGSTGITLGGTATTIAGLTTITTSSDITVNGQKIGKGGGNQTGNTVFGADAGASNTTGTPNSFFGTRSGYLNTTGNYNAFFGYEAGQDVVSGNSNTIIGSIAGGATGLSNTIIIAAGTTERIRVNSVGAMSVAGSATFIGDVTANASDKRLKDNIRVIDNPLEKLSKINGVYFNWNDTAKDLIHKSDDIEEVGFLAQEVQSVLPHIIKPAPFDVDALTGESKSGENYLTIQYEKIVPLLVEAIKELKKQVDELKNK